MFLICFSSSQYCQFKCYVTQWGWGYTNRHRLALWRCKIQHCVTMGWSLGTLLHLAHSFQAEPVPQPQHARPDPADRHRGLAVEHQDGALRGELPRRRILSHGPGHVDHVHQSRVSRRRARRTSEEDYEQCTATEDATERRPRVGGIPCITSTDRWRSTVCLIRLYYGVSMEQGGEIPRKTSRDVGVRRCVWYGVSLEQLVCLVYRVYSPSGVCRRVVSARRGISAGRHGSMDSRLGCRWRNSSSSPSGTRWMPTRLIYHYALWRYMNMCEWFILRVLL